MGKEDSGSYEVRDLRGATRPGRRAVALVVAAGVVGWLQWAGMPYNYSVKLTSPANEWNDDTWPLREGKGWDIATDFPRPRVLEYDVQEGTWLRLDVHPFTGDIVFDMVGDIYCIPGDEAFSEGDTTVSNARLVLDGVPYDSDPHFSPNGDRIVYRSDAGLGVENIWVVNWTGCGGSDAWSLRESAQRVTNETYRWLSDARFHPSGETVIASKWYMSSRSLGAGEAWEYNVPAIGSKTKVTVGTGTRVLERTLPAGSDDYGEEQIGPEQAIWHGANSLIFAKNVRDSTAFTYSKDVHKGIYAIFERNLTSGRTTTLVDAFPGGASRPELSRDGRTLAFVRRIRDHEMLVLKDLTTGTLHYAWDGLTYDLSIVSAPMGTYPSFAFSHDDTSIIIWAAGQIWNVPLDENDFGERIPARSPKPIRFTAHIKKSLGPLRAIEDIGLTEIETADTQPIAAFNDLRVNDKGDKVVFHAAGVTLIHVIGEERTTKAPVLYDHAPYYNPSFVEDEVATVIVHARWNDFNFTAFELSNVTEGSATEIEGLPKGRFLSPVISPSQKSPSILAFVKIDGDYLTGSVVATARPGLYVADVGTFADRKALELTNIVFVPSDVDPVDHLNMRFLPGSSSRLLVQQSSRAFVIDLAGVADADGKPPHYTVASGKMSKEITVSLYSPKSTLGRLWRAIREWSMGPSFDAYFVVFVDVFHIYAASGDKIKKEEMVWSRPGNATSGLARVTLDGGHDVAFSGDGKKIFWFLGPYLHSLELSKLEKCSSSIRNDRETFGIDCTRTILEYQKVVAEHSTDIARLKVEAEEHHYSDVVVILNATVLTMEIGKLEEDLISNGVLVIRGGVIESVGALEFEALPTGATVIDARGAFVVPGFIDMHAHWAGTTNPMPAKSWELETFLSYGVTTLHNPSSDNVLGFVERSRVERGHLIGPRIFHTGDVIYGAAEAVIHADIVDMDEAKSTLIRIKAEGGRISTSYKNYNLPSRAYRQRLLLAAQNLSMLCVPEGGMNYDWDLTYILDGMTTIEHAIPVPVLYDDVLTLYALSGTGSSPTHLVNYGGAMGEQFIWAEDDLPNDKKLRSLMPESVLEGLTESTSRPLSSYQLFNTSASVSKMVSMGLKAFIGAHGEPPLGVNYHGEMYFSQLGGLTNYEVYRAATSDAAQTLGLFGALGSLSPGKLADFVVFQPGVDILRGWMPESLKIVYVARGGRIWDAETMTEFWPVKGRKQAMPPFNP